MRVSGLLMTCLGVLGVVGSIMGALDKYCSSEHTSGAGACGSRLASMLEMVCQVHGGRKRASVSTLGRYHKRNKREY